MRTQAKASPRGGSSTVLTYMTKTTSQLLYVQKNIHIEVQAAAYHYIAML